jgi:hypothetical protein
MRLETMVLADFVEWQVVDLGGARFSERMTTVLVYKPLNFMNIGCM